MNVRNLHHQPDLTNTGCGRQLIVLCMTVDHIRRHIWEDMGHPNKQNMLPFPHMFQTRINSGTQCSSVHHCEHIENIWTMIFVLLKKTANRGKGRCHVFLIFQAFPNTPPLFVLDVSPQHLLPVGITHIRQAMSGWGETCSPSSYSMNLWLKNHLFWHPEHSR